MNKKTILIIITGIIAIIVVAILFFGPEAMRLNYDDPSAEPTPEEIEEAMRNLTAPSTESVLSPEENAIILERLSAPKKQ